MKITLKIKLIPTKEQKLILNQTFAEYVKTTNSLVGQMVDSVEILKLSSKNVTANLPSAIKNQCILDAKSIHKKHLKKVKLESKKPLEKQKEIKIPTLKKPVAIWNNQNYKVLENCIELPVLVDGKSKRISICAIITPEQRIQLENKLGTLRITIVNGKLIAQIAVEIAEEENFGSFSMGVDLGLKIPAVAVTKEGKTKFFGNGRQNKYMKRKFGSKRKELGKLKKLKAIKKLNNKEQRYMKDQDHKVSREIINFAKSNNVSIIRMEQLTNIRNTARTSRKNEKNLHTWSFYRLAQYIEYKAILVGIKVEYVNPKYTSQICPSCGTKNHAKDRNYECSCGYHAHRDRVGAMNIINAPVIDGKSLSA